MDDLEQVLGQRQVDREGRPEMGIETLELPFQEVFDEPIVATPQQVLGQRTHVSVDAPRLSGTKRLGTKEVTDQFDRP